MSNRKTYLDIMNVISMFLIVELNCTQIFVGKFSFTLNIVLNCLIKGLFIFSIPMFIMLSGSNLLDYRSKYDSVIFFKKRINKVVLPLIFWSLIWYFYNVFISKNMHLGIKTLLNSFFYNKIQPNFWFLYLMIGLYLVTPILNIIVKNSKSITFYLLFIYLIFGATVPFVCHLLGKNNFVSNFGIPFTVGTLGYYIFGFIIEYFNLKEFTIRLFINVGIAFGVGTVLFSMVIYFVKGYTKWNVYDIFGLPVVLFSFGMFCWLRNKFINIKFSHKVKKNLEIMAKCSLGIFLIQQFFINYFVKFFSNRVYTFWHILFIPIFVYLLCLLVILILKKIPLIKKLVP